MTVAGEGKAPARRHLLALAEPAGISNREAEEILEQVATSVARFSDHAHEAGLSRKVSRELEKAIALCLARL